MSMEEIEASRVSLLGNHDARWIGVFGSYTRGEQRPDSDLDILVDFRDRKSLLTLIRIVGTTRDQSVAPDRAVDQSIPG